MSQSCFWGRTGGRQCLVGGNFSWFKRFLWVMSGRKWPGIPDSRHDFTFVRNLPPVLRVKRRVPTHMFPEASPCSPVFDWSEVRSPSRFLGVMSHHIFPGTPDRLSEHINVCSKPHTGFGIKETAFGAGFWRYSGVRARSRQYVVGRSFGRFHRFP